MNSALPPPNKKIGYSIMAVAVGFLLLLFSAPFLLSTFSYILNTVNSTTNSSIRGTLSTLTSQLGYSYSDPFTTSLQSSLYPVLVFLYKVSTTPIAFYTLIALDMLLIAFDVYWLEQSQE